MAEENDFGQLYVMENGVMKPVSVGRPGKRPKYPLHKLNVGESFFVSDRTTVIHYLYQRAKRLNIKIVQRQVTEEDDAGQPVQGVRVWRTE